jgi:hypothetical protein
VHALLAKLRASPGQDASQKSEDMDREHPKFAPF